MRDKLPRSRSCRGCWTKATQSQLLWRMKECWVDTEKWEQKSFGRRSGDSGIAKVIWWELWVGCGEGNGNPLQCSCLENPRDGGAWEVAVYGVTQSRTWLKRLSSSSSWVGWSEARWIKTWNSTPKLCSSLKNNYQRILDSKMTWLVSLDNLSVQRQCKNSREGTQGTSDFVKFKSPIFKLVYMHSCVYGTFMWTNT